MPFVCMVVTESRPGLLFSSGSNRRERITRNWSPQSAADIFVTCHEGGTARRRLRFRLLYPLDFFQCESSLATRKVSIHVFGSFRQRRDCSFRGDTDVSQGSRCVAADFPVIVLVFKDAD